MTLVALETEILDRNTHSFRNTVSDGEMHYRTTLFSRIVRNVLEKGNASLLLLLFVRAVEIHYRSATHSLPLSLLQL
jgi:hypothetical protein